MKIIDEKGKLFGKLNIIDLLVILIVIALAVVLAVRAMPGTASPDPAESQGPTTPITYQVKVVKVDAKTYETIRQFVDPAAGKKDQLFSSDSGNKFLDAYVVDCTAMPHVEYLATEDGQIKRVESSGEDDRLDLVFTIEANVDNTTTNKVGRQQIRANVAHTIKTTHFEFANGLVIYVEWPESNNA